VDYTIKKLAKLSGVSIRTLHWYDKIGLLKPACYKPNGYRIYREEQLLLLQQIRFFKELGFTLKDIQKLLDQDDFDNIKALYVHRQLLQEEIERKNELIRTLNKTMQHLNGRLDMKQDEEFYKGFDEQTKARVIASLEKFRNTFSDEIWLKMTLKATPEQKKNTQQRTREILINVTDLMQKGFNADTAEVQKHIGNLANLLQEVWLVLSKETFLCTAEDYECPTICEFLAENYAHGLGEFVATGIRVYVEENMVACL
jgi:DNA-binding transcriptional MerR regulator